MHIAFGKMFGLYSRVLGSHGNVGNDMLSPVFLTEILQLLYWVERYKCGIGEINKSWVYLRDDDCWDCRGIEVDSNIGQLSSTYYKNPKK